MKGCWYRTGLSLVLLSLAVVAGAGSPNQKEPPRLWFDTDITGDVDDVLALAMLHTLEDRGACRFLGVSISKVNPFTGPFTDAVNTFYGRPDLPIGITRAAQVRGSRYLKLVEEKDEGGRLRYPHDLKRNEDAPEAVAMMRRVFATQPDHSVVLVQVGLAVNFARLLRTGPDAHSPLAGKDLVRRKVRLLSIMAGSFQTINADNHYLEANVKNDVPSMKALAQEWPDDVPVVWSGFEIGIAVPYPAVSVLRDFNYVTHHPVREAYILYQPPPHERPTWDLTSVLYAVYPDRGYFDLSPAGRVTVGDDGFTRFQPKAKGRDRYLIMSAQQTARVREALVQFVTQPPLKP